MPKSDTPRIYVACLASYNCGTLHGEWVDATLDVKDLEEEIQKILAKSPVPDAEEWAVHDYDGFYDTASYIGEYPNLADVVEIARFIEEHGRIAAKLVSHFCGNISDAKRAYEGYQGCYESLADYAEEFCENCGYEIPDWANGYINWESMAIDWELNGDIFTIQISYREIHVFRNC